MQLHEEYRPKCWADVAGQDKVIARIQALAKRGLSGRAYWLSGASGTGKTTIGKLIAAEVADDWNTEEIDAALLTPKDLQDMERDMSTRGLGKGGKAYLINEAHALRKATIRQLLVLLERLPKHVVIVFTTTTAGQTSLFEDCDDADPLLSRCVRLDLATRGIESALAKRAMQVAKAEGLDGGYGVDHFERLVAARNSNLRMLFQDIEAGYLVRA
jgi:replication-associated recombination protein RarA